MTIPDDETTAGVGFRTLNPGGTRMQCILLFRPQQQRSTGTRAEQDAYRSHASTGAGAEDIHSPEVVFLKRKARIERCERESR